VRCDATRFHLEDFAKAKGERPSCRRHHTLRAGEWTGMGALVRTLDDGAIALHGDRKPIGLTVEATTAQRTGSSPGFSRRPARRSGRRRAPRRPVWRCRLSSRCSADGSQRFWVPDAARPPPPGWTGRSRCSAIRRPRGQSDRPATVAGRSEDVAHRDGVELVWLRHVAQLCRRMLSRPRCVALFDRRAAGDGRSKRQRNVRA
jgi:hypothetical protein